MGPVYERLVELVAPRPGDRFLDVGCGTGGVALVAARAGADVTGVDISPGQLEKARAAAAEAGLVVAFDEGDAQALPYGDASFDAVVSAFGLIFAPDHAQAAAEVARVTLPGARIAITSWPEDAWHRVNAKLRPDYEQTGTKRWSDEGYVRPLFPAFELTFGEGETTISAGSADELWELLSSSVPGLKAFLDAQDEDGREAARREFQPLLETGELTRTYVIVGGTRR